MTTHSFRPARIDDAAVLAELVNYAGEGLPLYLWGKLASAGETAWDIGHMRAARETGSFSYRNATIIEHEGQAAGSLIGYAIPDVVEPIPADMPAMFGRCRSWKTLLPAHGTSTCSPSCHPIEASVSEPNCCVSQTTSDATTAVAA